jgi:hypothetical protein
MPITEFFSNFMRFQVEGSKVMKGNELPEQFDKE